MKPTTTAPDAAASETSFSVIRDVPGLPLVCHHPHLVPGLGHVRLPSEDLHRLGRWRLGDGLAPFVEHGPDLGEGRAGDHSVADTKRSPKNQVGGHRTAAGIQMGLERDAPGRRLGIRLELEDVRDQHDGLQEPVEVLSRLGRHVDELELAPPFGRNDPLIGELLADSLGVRLWLVDLVHRHDDRNLGRPGVVQRLDGLRHHAVVRRYHQDDDVGDLGSPGTHGGESLVTGCVDEGDLPAIVMDLVRPDVLGDAAELLRHDVGTPDGVQQQGLPVVDVPHDGDDRGPRNEPRLIDRLLLFLLELLLRANHLHRPAQLVSHQLDRLVGQRLGGRDHLARGEEHFHDLCGRRPQLLGEVLRGRASRDPECRHGGRRSLLWYRDFFRCDRRRLGRRLYRGRRLRDLAVAGLSARLLLCLALPASGELISRRGARLAPRLHPASSRADARDGLLRHGRGRGATLVSHCLEGLQHLFARHPELFGQFVDPQASSPTSLRSSSISLAASGCPSWDCRARAIAPRRTANLKHSLEGWTYAPRPAARPVGSTATRPSGLLTTRMSARFCVFDRHPTHVRSGCRFPAMVLPTGRHLRLGGRVLSHQGSFLSHRR